MRMTKGRKQEIREALEQGANKASLASKYGVSISAITQVATPTGVLDSNEFVDPTETVVDEVGPKIDVISDAVSQEADSDVPPQAVTAPPKEADLPTPDGIFCVRCGKPLSKDSSVSAGMGDVCQSHEHIDYVAHYETLAFKTKPDEERWILALEAGKILKKELHVFMNHGLII